MTRIADQIRVMSWNVRGFNTIQDELQAEILRWKPHIAVLQETQMWIENERDLKWPGAKILNMEAQQLTVGKRGGLAVIISPEINYTEIHIEYIGDDRTRQERENLTEHHLQNISIFDSEALTPEEDVDGHILVQLEGPTTPEPPQQHRKKGTTSNTKRGSKSETDPVSDVNGECANTQENATNLSRKRKKRKRKKEPATEFLQAITVQLENGLTITGTYISPTTKAPTVEIFLSKTLKEYGQKQMIIGDMNARQRLWDTRSNERGNAVAKAVRETERTYIAAADIPSYFKVIKRKKRKERQHGWWNARVIQKFLLPEFKIQQH